jgi:DNA-binding transcriptional LysR family regulator
MDGKRIDFNLLVTLEALLIEQNVTKAAARLHLTQPAVSTQLSRLRTLFDDPLLIPAQRGMTPTAKAIELLAPLRQALDQLRATVVTDGDFDPRKAKLTVAIACTDYAQKALIEPLAIELRDKAPGIRVAVRNLDLSQLEAQMARGDVDLGLMRPEDTPPNLRMRHLFDEQYVLIGRRAHPRLRRKLTAEEFAKLEHVVVSLRGGEFATPVDKTLATLGLKRNVVLSAASFLFIPEIVANSNFVALVPARLVSHRTGRLKVVSCPLPVEGFAMGMAWHERNHGHGGHRWIRHLIASLVGLETSGRKRGTARP